MSTYTGGTHIRAVSSAAGDTSQLSEPNQAVLTLPAVGVYNSPKQTGDSDQPSPGASLKPISNGSKNEHKENSKSPIAITQFKPERTEQRSASVQVTQLAPFKPSLNRPKNSQDSKTGSEETAGSGFIVAQKNQTPLGQVLPFGAGVAQFSGLNIAKNGPNWEIIGRPGFRAFVKPALVAKYNQANNASYDPATISLADEELDQCHKVSWHDIRQFILTYINKGSIADDHLRDHVAILYNNEQSDEATKGLAAVNMMIKLKNSGMLNSDIIREVCELLNSATPNLRLDDASMNRKIKEHFDPNLVMKPDGKRSLSPHSRLIANSSLVDSKLRRSPGGTHGYSSSAGEFEMTELSQKTAATPAFQ